MQAIIQWLIQGGVVIDVRDLQNYQQKHLQPSCHIALDDLVKRAHELPNKSIGLALLAESVLQLEQAKKWFAERCYCVVHAWLASDLEYVELAPYLTEGDCVHYAWQPNGLLRECLDKGWLPSSGQALDIGCGSGRDSVFLAKQGWQVTAIDYRADLLERAQQLAAAHQCQLTTLARDIEASPEPFSDLPLMDLIIVFRYLHRPLFNAIMRQLKPNGFIVYQTFMQGCEKFGSPKNPNFLLAPDELAGVFADFDIWLDRQELLEDGRPVNSFVARKR